jgi:hypothetical protein
MNKITVDEVQAGYAIRIDDRVMVLSEADFHLLRQKMEMMPVLGKTPHNRRNDFNPDQIEILDETGEGEMLTIRVENDGIDVRLGGRASLDGGSLDQKLLIEPTARNSVFISRPKR